MLPFDPVSRFQYYLHHPSARPVVAEVTSRLAELVRELPSSCCGNLDGLASDVASITTILDLMRAPSVLVRVNALHAFLPPSELTAELDVVAYALYVCCTQSPLLFKLDQAAWEAALLFPSPGQDAQSPLVLV
jgi:hypothetical protein